MTRHTILFLSLGAALLAACGDKDDPADTGTSGGDDGADTDDGGGDDGGSDGGGDDGGEDPATGTVGGVVSVQLYQTGEDGEREGLSWEDGTGGEFIFGKIFVTAYYDDAETGGRRYVAQTVIDAPTTGENPYDLDVELDDDQELYVYAVLDYYQDNIVGSDEPKGVYPHGVEFVDGTNFDEADIEILTPLYGGGGGSCDVSSVSGDVDITDTWVDGDVFSMVLTTGGEGPLHSTSSTPVVSGGGAAATFDFATCAAYGDTNLVGAWDKNGNGMADPLDKWGVVVEDGEDANPVDVSSDLSGLTIQIPFGDEPGISLVPFVRLSGTVNVEGGTFDDLAAGSTVYVTALKYKPNGDFDITDLSIAYDADEYDWTELTGQSEVPFTVVVPSNTVVYLWAFADENADGIVNESGDYVAAGGEESGKVATGTSNSSGLELSLGVVSGG